MPNEFSSTPTPLKVYHDVIKVYSDDVCILIDDKHLKKFKQYYFLIKSIKRIVHCYLNECANNIYAMKTRVDHF